MKMHASIEKTLCYAVDPWDANVPQAVQPAAKLKFSPFIVNALSPI